MSCILLALTLAASLLAPRASAQAPGSDALPAADTAPAVAAAESTAKSAAPASGAVGPDVFFLPDAAGNLRRVLGYRYEDFLQSWRAAQLQQADTRQPTFALANLAAAANVKGDDVAVEFHIDVDLQSAEWVEVPLELGGLIVSKWEVSGDEERDFVLFDAQRQGYVAWLKGRPGERRTVSFTGKLLVQRDGDSRQLEIDLPAAATSHIDFTASSQVEVEAPKSVALATVTADDGRYTAQIDGAKGLLALRWGPRAVEEFDRAATLSAAIDAAVTVEPGRLTYEAVVTLRSFGEALDRARIRLPRGAAAAATPPGSGYEVIPIASAAGRNGAALVEVRFDQPSTTPPPVRLVAEYSGADAAAPLFASSFDVVGAFRQRSQLAIRVSELLHADFQTAGRVEQIDPLDLPEALRTPAPLAAFVGAGADWQLDVETQPRQRKVRATPTYAMNLGSQGATLDVTVDYQFLGGRTFELRADLRGWELTEQPVESGGVVDLTEQHVTPAGVLVMPLKESDLQQARVRFTLRREAGLGLHDLPLPELLDAFNLPGTLSVTCDEAWRAIVQVDNSSGVATAEANGAVAEANAAAAPAAAPAANGAISSAATSAPRRDAAARRFQTFLPRARVAIDVSEQEQAVAVESIVEGRMAGDSLEVEQRLQYNVAYQPTSELSMTVATELLANHGLQLLLDGRPLASSAVEILPLAPGPAGSTEDNLRLLVRLPRPTVGRIVLQIRSVHALNDSQQLGRSPITIPLAIPTQPAGARATITSPVGQPRVALWSDGQNELWRPAAPEATGVGGDQQPAIFAATSAKPVGELALRLESAPGAEPLDLRAEATWIQTWIVGGQRQDRYVYRFRTGAPRVELTLPDDFAGRPLEVKLDGQTIPAKIEGALLSAPLAAAETPQVHTLELRRQTQQHLAVTAGLGASFPTLEHAQGSSPIFWQLIVPRDMAAVTTPEGMNGEYRLGWREWSWGRQPTQSQADLEKWTSATAAPELPASTNEYLYSAFDAPPHVHVRLVRRSWLIVAAAAAALAVGLIALYTNLGRTAGFWLAAIIAAVATLAAYPEAAILLVQAIFLGGAFTIVSLATRWLLADVRVRRSSAAVPASSIVSLTATQPWLAGRQDDSDDAVVAASGSTRQHRETPP
ncbi:MAG: hypothetical protein JNL18_11215 [Planctomycetaceae bacterium]|nr:hypothetical protein [Planctomycetaceae bacterium]